MLNLGNLVNIIKCIQFMCTALLPYIFDDSISPTASRVLGPRISFHSFSLSSTSPDIFFETKSTKHYHIAIHLYHFSFRFAGRHSLESQVAATTI